VTVRRRRANRDGPGPTVGGAGRRSARTPAAPRHTPSRLHAKALAYGLSQARARSRTRPRPARRPSCACPGRHSGRRSGREPQTWTLCLPNSVRPHGVACTPVGGQGCGGPAGERIPTGARSRGVAHRPPAPRFLHAGLANELAARASPWCPRIETPIGRERDDRLGLGIDLDALDPLQQLGVEGWRRSSQGRWSSAFTFPRSPVIQPTPYEHIATITRRQPFGRRWPLGPQLKYGGSGRRRSDCRVPM
jgi:hypothetical protein